MGRDVVTITLIGKRVLAQSHIEPAAHASAPHDDEAE